MDKEECIIVDLEGTLTDCSHRIHYWKEKNYNLWNSLFSSDIPNIKMLEIIRKNIRSNKKIIICTAKSDEQAKPVYDWLKIHYCWRGGPTTANYANCPPTVAHCGPYLPILSDRLPQAADIRSVPTPPAAKYPVRPRSAQAGRTYRLELPRTPSLARRGTSHPRHGFR